MGWLGLVLWGSLLTLSASAQDLDFRYVAELVQSQDIRTVEALLSRLPPTYRASYVVAYESRSLQGATARAPRVILYGDRAKLLLAFNGDPALPGYHSVEAMEFLDREARFELHEILFSEQGERARISEANPAKCLRCHRADPRPNWESYNTWPGFYASESHPTPHGKLDPLKPAEETDWLAFLKIAPDHPRYRHLVERETKFRSPRAGIDYRGDVEYRYDYERDYKPTTHLSHLLIRRNGHRIARLIRESRDYPRQRYAVLAALSKCADIESFLPDDVRARWPLSYATVFREVKTAVEAGGNSFEQSYDDNPATISKLRYLLEPNGVAVTSFSMAFRHPPYGFIGPDRYEGLGVLEPLLSADPLLKAARRSCPELRALSRQAWSAAE